ncbi:MAG: hypothetical protein H0T62_02565 [Parachlamydiaceae bacterium]|nr:hypothetical protein [Parachlamydiaceae bacterium]
MKKKNNNVENGDAQSDANVEFADRCQFAIENKDSIELMKILLESGRYGDPSSEVIEEINELNELSKQTKSSSVSGRQ